ncbi:type II toxin-antitoxin system YafO family toxin [Marinibactrum halimedae]|uniref:Uncharacterized protein n=1 Tax=Marinibactrum halimedae TaxID=1444977 RepID=A0AA37WQC1_9GAMM|nr:hypothetical protein GCM10007877_27410 [Marinibactrum halimedae]
MHPTIGLTLQEKKNYLQANRKWSLRTVQFKRTSDTALIYCYGWSNPTHYLLIAVIEDAHRKANNTLFMGTSINSFF